MSTVTLSSREEWLAERRNGLGASDVAAALGISPWKSPFALWSEKTGQTEADDLSAVERVEWGLRLERPIGEAFAQRTGRRVEMAEPYTIIRHPVYPFLFCTPDAEQFADAGTGTLQIKTTSAYNGADWEDEPPLHYEVQLQTELEIMGNTWGSLAVLIGGQKLRWFDRDRHARAIEAIVPELEKFWKRVVFKQPPPVDSSAATAKILAKLHPQDSGNAIDLPADAADWDAELTAISEQMKALEERETLLKNQIKEAIGDNTFGYLPNGARYSWKTQERKSYTVSAGSSRVLRRLK